MAPVEQKEYFYQWPYMVFGDTFENVLVLGAGSGTDVAAALKHGAKHVDAVEIDPVIVRLGRQYHPDHPYSDPRVTVITDDARHFLRTTTKKYDLVVFALIDSLTMQSSFSGVRLESYMFTEESFRAVRDRLAPDGLLVVYNYFREKWLVDRLANIAANAFGQEPRVHVHEARAYLGILMVGPRLTTLTSDPVIPDRVTAFGQSHAPSPARMHVRDASVEPATDDWPFLYLHNRHIPSHYLAALALVLVVSIVVVLFVLRGQPGAWSWQFFLLGAGFMLLETKSIIQFALLWGSTWVVASLAIASVLSMALVANYVVGESRGAPPVARRRGTARPARAQLRHSGRGDRVREPRGGVAVLCRLDVQPDSLRRAAVRLGDQAVHVARARLRHEPPRRDGWRRRRVPLAGHRLPDAAAGDRDLLRGSDCGEAKSVVRHGLTAGSRRSDGHVTC